MTLDEYLADLAAKAGRATPGPWAITETDHRMRIHPGGWCNSDLATWREHKSGARRGESPRWRGWTEREKANAAHIAAFSPDVAAALVAVAEAARHAKYEPTLYGAPAWAADLCDALARLTALARTR